MERIVQRAAGLDVHKDVIAAEVHLPGGVVEQGRFGTTTPGLLVLRDWLTGYGVTRVGMESTGVYWKPPYYMLEDAMEVWLLNARHMRNLPGRKTDTTDASWICQLIEFGLVRPSFVPPQPVPGIDLRTAQGLLAEIGADMDVFGTASRLSSWAAVCPGNHESAGRSKSGKTRKGPKWLGIYLHDAAMSAIRTKNTYLAAQYTRLRPRLDHNKALVAVEHSILVAVFHMFQHDRPYHDLGPDYFIRREDPHRRARKLIRQLEAIGYTVHTEPPPAAA